MITCTVYINLPELIDEEWAQENGIDLDLYLEDIEVENVAGGYVSRDLLFTGIPALGSVLVMDNFVGGEVRLRIDEIQYFFRDYSVSAIVLETSVVNEIEESSWSSIFLDMLQQGWK